MKETLELRKEIKEFSKISQQCIVHPDYTVWVVNQCRGICHYDKRYISIPLWAVIKGKEFRTYYFCHEAAHSWRLRGNHDREFMLKFMELCPKNCQHFELNYKPQQAKAAGISEKEDSGIQN